MKTANIWKERFELEKDGKGLLLVTQGDANYCFRSGNIKCGDAQAYVCNYCSCYRNWYLDKFIKYSELVFAVKHTLQGNALQKNISFLHLGTLVSLSRGSYTY